MVSKKQILLAAAFGLMASGASAQSMNAQAFYSEATALKAKGPMALFSLGRVRALTKEAEAAGQAARARRAAMVAKGETPHFCPPAQRSNIGQDEFMAYLGSLPAAERARMSMTDVMVRLFTKKFPC